MTINQFESYMMDVKGFDQIEVNNVIKAMKEEGAPLEDFLNQEEIAETNEWNKTGMIVMPMY